MENTKKSKVTLIVAIVLCVAMVATGTFAWFMAKDDVQNHFGSKQITDGSVSIFEVFDPPDDVKPGAKVIKEVGVANTGEVNVFARLSFEEILKLLKNSGQQTTLLQGATVPADYIPVKVTVAAYQNWTAVTAAECTAAIPADVKIWKKSVTDSQGKTISSYYAYRELGGTPATYQKMGLIRLTSAGLIDISNLSYYYFEGKDTYQKDWALPNVHVTDPGATPPAAPITFPAKTSPALSDPHGKMTLEFGDITAVLTLNNWYYNAADGYFYYMGVLKPGDISPMLLKAWHLDSSAADDYALMEFDLYVLMDAIQNTSDAVASSTGWNMPTTSPVYQFYLNNNLFEY